MSCDCCGDLCFDDDIYEMVTWRDGDGVVLDEENREDERWCLWCCQVQQKLLRTFWEVHCAKAR